MATIEEMLVDIARRLTSSFVAVSLMLMALSACASGPMTMAEMICCVDHQDLPCLPSSLSDSSLFFSIYGRLLVT